jgi:hypothetical protein
LRERVAPKGSGEGSRRVIRYSSRNPSSDGYAATFSRKGRRDHPPSAQSPKATKRK